jgi:hypothetical protein
MLSAGRFASLTVRCEYSREPGILVVTPSQLGARMMALKISLPALNIPELIRRYPKALRDEVGLLSWKHCKGPKKSQNCA